MILKKSKGRTLKFELDLSTNDFDEQEVAYLSKRIFRMLQNTRIQLLKKKNPFASNPQDVLTAFRQPNKSIT